MKILSVDIAARVGGRNCGLTMIDAALIDALDRPTGDLLWARSIDGTDLRAVAEAVGEAKSAGALLVLERQYAARVAPNPAVTEKLIATRIRFETVAQIRGVEFELVYPATWQTILDVLGSDVPQKPAKPRKVKGAKPAAQVELAVKAPKMIRDTKAASRLLASRLYPGAELTQDECDAVLMGRHVAWERRGT